MSIWQNTSLPLSCGSTLVKIIHSSSSHQDDDELPDGGGTCIHKVQQSFSMDPWVLTWATFTRTHPIHCRDVCRDSSESLRGVAAGAGIKALDILQCSSMETEYIFHLSLLPILRMLKEDVTTSSMWIMLQGTDDGVVYAHTPASSTQQHPSHKWSTTESSQDQHHSEVWMPIGFVHT